MCAESKIVFANIRGWQPNHALQKLAFNSVLYKLNLLEGKEQQQINCQIDELIKIENRYNRRNLQLASQVENQKNLNVTYQALLNQRFAYDPKLSLSIARLAAQGWNFKSKQKAKLNTAYRNAKTKLTASSRGRPTKYDETYLLQALVDHHYTHYGVLPKSGFDQYSGQYKGEGFDFILTIWQLIAGIKIKRNSLGRYLDDEKSRISLILKQ